MLLSIISSSTISSSTISYSAIYSSAVSSSVISMVTSPGLPPYGSTVVVGLITLLSLKEVLSASTYWNQFINTSFNQAIVPLLLSFTFIVIFKADEILLFWFLKKEFSFPFHFILVLDLLELFICNTTY